MGRELPAVTGSNRLFFAQLLRDAFARSASGVFQPFPHIDKGTLKVLLHSLGHDADETTLKDILGVFSRFPAHKDVKPALEKLRNSECQAVCSPMAPVPIPKTGTRQRH
jgi:2-haloacid dehalogenase